MSSTAPCGRGQPIRSAPPTTAREPTSRCSPRSPSKVELCLIAKDGTEERINLDEVDGYVWHCLPADRHPGPALRLPGPRAVGSRGRASLRSEQAAARPVRQVLPRRLRLHPGAVLLRPEGRRSRGRRHAADDRLAGPHHDQRGDQPVLRLGVRPRAAHAVPRDRHLRGPRQGHDADPSRHPRGTARHLRRARAIRRSSTTSSRSTSPRSS